MPLVRLSLILSLVSTAAVAQTFDAAPSTVVQTAPLLAGFFGADPDGCPLPDFRATAQEIFDRRFQALLAGDIQTLTCLYAPDATVMLPGSIVRGRANIVPAFLQFGSLFGGAVPQLTSVTADRFVVMANFTLVGPTLSIPDGSDTYVIVGGRVVYQTVHSTIVPNPQP
jgi:hypothetical protein